MLSRESAQWPILLHHSYVKMKLQQIDGNHHGGSRFVLCLQYDHEQGWDCRAVRQAQLDKTLGGLGFEDDRDTVEIYQQARAAVREFGLGVGYVEFAIESGQVLNWKRLQGHPRIVAG